MKAIAKAILYAVFLAALVLSFGEAETPGLQLIYSGSALLVMWLSYKGLRRLGAF